MALIMGENLAPHKKVYLKPDFKREKSISISNSSVFFSSPVEEFILPNHNPQPGDESAGQVRSEGE